MPTKLSILRQKHDPVLTLSVFVPQYNNTFLSYSFFPAISSYFLWYVVLSYFICTYLVCFLSCMIFAYLYAFISKHIEWNVQNKLDFPSLYLTTERPDARDSLEINTFRWQVIVRIWLLTSFKFILSLSVKSWPSEQQLTDWSPLSSAESHGLQSLSCLGTAAFLEKRTRNGFVS